MSIYVLSRNFHKTEDYEDGTKSFRIYHSLTLEDTEDYDKNMDNWNYKEYTLDKIESVQDEKTIFFSLDHDLDVRYWEIFHFNIF